MVPPPSGIRQAGKRTQQIDHRAVHHCPLAGTVKTDNVFVPEGVEGIEPLPQAARQGATPLAGAEAGGRRVQAQPAAMGPSGRREGPETRRREGTADRRNASTQAWASDS